MPNERSLTLISLLMLVGTSLVGPYVLFARGQAASADVREAILSAEDRRAPDRASLDVLTGALGHPDPVIQRLAVRALGRLERPALVPALTPMLASADASVRAEAANALAQAVSAERAAAAADAAPRKPSAVTDVQSLLARQLERETQPEVRGVICESLGRLPYRTVAEAQAAEKLLVASIGFAAAAERATPSAAPMPTLARAVKGLESLLRQNAKLFQPSAETVDVLKGIVLSGRELTALRAGPPKPYAPLNLDPTGEDDPARVRRLALLALGAQSAADQTTLAAAMADADWEVRRVAVRVAGAGLRAPDAEVRKQRLAIVMTGLGDASWHVRYDALSAFGRNMAAPECRVLLTAVADPNPHVSVLAVDLLPACGARSDASRVVGGLVRVAPNDDTPWQRTAHALVALARLAPEQAAAQLPRLIGSPVWQVRAYVARAAAIARASDVLRTLAADANDNVRTAAVAGLSEVEQHGADEIFISQLTRTDPQLVRTAANALEGTPDAARALPALSQALAMFTSQHRDTSRDVRLALLERVGELSSKEQAATVDPYVRDFDPRVARAAAAIVKQWTGVQPPVRPAAPPSAPPPTLAQVRELEGAKAVVRMKSGTFTLRLLPADAPAAVARFAKLARAGYYNGLTFHRVEPGALIQGGSPGANEYAGDGPFMRDELGFASNRRGSVGVSTRGRDTGDAQWYVNVVDNARYDHNYTVFAVVESGMDVVDAVVEGDVIQEVRIVTVGSAL